MVVTQRSSIRSGSDHPTRTVDRVVAAAARGEDVCRSGPTFSERRGTRREIGHILAVLFALQQRASRPREAALRARAILPRAVGDRRRKLKHIPSRHRACILPAQQMSHALRFGLESPQLVVEEFTSVRAFTDLEREWRAIESHSGTPFATWDWAFAWWAQLREEKLGVTDSLSLRTVRTLEGRLVAVAPMLISRRPSVGPIRVRQLQFFGADPNITEQRGFVAVPEWRSQAYRALVAHALQHAEGWDCMLLSGVPADLDFGALSNSPDFEWVGQTSDFVLELPDTWEALRTRLPRNIKESLRKCYNSLAREGRVSRLRVAQTADEVDPALEDFFALHAARSQRSDTVHHYDIFSTTEAQQFLRDVCRRFALRGALRIFQLLVDEKVVAIRIGFAIGETLYLYYSGYDPEFARYSVMTTTVAEAMQYGISHGFRQVNLSTGKDVSKTRWDPSERVTRQALVVSGSKRAKITHQMYRHALQAVGAIPALRRATFFLTRRSPPSAQALR